MPSALFDPQSTSITVLFHPSATILQHNFFFEFMSLMTRVLEFSLIISLLYILNFRSCLLDLVVPVRILTKYLFSSFSSVLPFSLQKVDSVLRVGECFHRS